MIALERGGRQERDETKSVQERRKERKQASDEREPDKLHRGGGGGGERLFFNRRFPRMLLPFPFFVPGIRVASSNHPKK